MAVHVAILKKPYIDMILAGRKTVESRLTKTPLAPYRCVKPGEKIYLKISAGPFRAVATAKDVEYHDDLTPRKVATIRQRLGHAIGGDDEYWKSKQYSKYATLITLTDVQPVKAGPDYGGSRGLAWFSLPERENPVSFDVSITKGSLRNKYVRVPTSVYEFPAQAYGGRTADDAGRPFELCLPDGQIIKTDIVSNQMLRWRGWGDYFQSYDLNIGDKVRFTRESPWRYRVRFVRGNGS